MVVNREGELDLPILPLIDLLLLAGCGSLFTGFVLKGVAMMTSYRPAILGLSSADFLLIAIATLLLAIALAARTWVRTQQPAAVAARRSQETLDAWNKLSKNSRVSEGHPDLELGLRDQQ
jgi:hypothetical protein